MFSCHPFVSASVHSCMHAYVHPECCFRNICGIDWWIFSKLFSVVQLGTKLK